MTGMPALAFICRNFHDIGSGLLSLASDRAETWRLTVSGGLQISPIHGLAMARCPNQARRTGSLLSRTKPQLKRKGLLEI
jgi:hypothetical protein